MATIISLLPQNYFVGHNQYYNIDNGFEGLPCGAEGGGVTIGGCPFTVNYSWLCLALCLQYVSGQDAPGVARADEISCEMDRCGALAKLLHMYILSSSILRMYILSISAIDRREQRLLQLG